MFHVVDKLRVFYRITAEYDVIIFKFQGSERLLLFFHHDAHEITVNISFDDARLCTCIELNGSA